MCMGHRTQIILEDEQYRFLKAKAQKEGASIAELVRRLIEGEMRQRIDYRKSPLLRLQPIDTGLEDGSVRHDDYIYRRQKQ